MTNKYLRTIYGVDKEGNAGSLQVDVYDILDAYPTRNPALDHLVKKALCPGQRGHKDLLTDLDDIIKSAQRAKQMAMNKMSCMAEVTLHASPEDVRDVKATLERIAARQHQGPTTARPTSFATLDSIYVFREVLSDRSMQQLRDSAAGVCRITRIRHIDEARIGSAVVGSFRETDKTVDGRHCFTVKDALSILNNDQRERAAANLDAMTYHEEAEQAELPAVDDLPYVCVFSDRPTSFKESVIYILESVEGEALSELEKVLDTPSVETAPEYVRSFSDCPDGAIVIGPDGDMPFHENGHWHFTVDQAIDILINDQKGNDNNA